MINRYQGNSGRVVRYEEQGERGARSAEKRSPPPASPGAPASPAGFTGLESLGRLLPEKIGELETEDIILLLILYLMYRESGDSELLIIMGAMFLL